MDREQWRDKRAQQRLVILIIAFSLISFVLNAQEFTGQIILEKTSFTVNEEFKFTIMIPEILPYNFELIEPEFPPGLQIIAGPDIRPGRNGSTVDYTFFTTETGRFIIDSFSIKTKKTTMYTPPVFITVTSTFQIRGSFDKAPPAINWAIPEGDYFVGEIIPLRFVVENIETPNLIIESDVSQKPDGFIRKISRYGQKSETTTIVKNVMTGEIYDFLFHDNIFIPFKSGEITLPNVEIYLSEGDLGYRAILKGITFNILPLPQSVKSTNAIGNFSYTYEISDTKLSEYHAILLRQRISGKGNFYGLSLLKPFSNNPDAISITLIRDSYDITPSGKLFDGYRELLYTVKKKIPENLDEVDKNTHAIITIPEFEWLNYDETKPVNSYTLSKADKKIVEIEIIKDAKPDSIPAIIPVVYPIKNRGIFNIIIIVLFLSVVPAIYFLFGKKMKKRFLVVVIIIAICIAIMFTAQFLFRKNVNGFITSEDPVAVPIYMVPEETGTVKFQIEQGESVKITGEKDRYYLIETQDNRSGWVNIENIILE